MKKFTLSAVIVSMSMAACANTPPQKEERPARAERSGQGPNAGPINSIAMGGLWLAGLDRDGDYLVTRAEFETGKVNAFNAANLDNNQGLSLFELDDWRVKALGSEDASPGRFVFDPDFDQNISQNEFNTTLDGIFTRVDRDKNNVLERAEILRIIDRTTRGRQGGQGARRQGGQGTGRQGGRGGGRGRGQGGGGGRRGG